MKTSNKILVGFLVVVFTIPLLLAMSLKNKMANGEYVVKKNDGEYPEHKRTGQIDSFSVVKVVAPNPGLLQCRLKLSDEMDYSYHNFSDRDSLAIYNRNDTLFVQYLSKENIPNEKNNYEGSHFNVTIHVATLKNLVVDGAVVIIDSLPGSMGSLSVSLLNNGVVKDGTQKQNRDQTRIEQKGRKEIENDEHAIHPAKINKGFHPIEQAASIEKQVLGELQGVDFKDMLINRLMYHI